MQKDLQLVLLIIVLIVLAWLISLLEISRQKELAPQPEESVFCTMDAKMCPDGSYVGRIPPECNFAPCPGEITE